MELGQYLRAYILSTSMRLRENQLEMKCSFKSPSSAPSDTPPVRRSHLLILPQNSFTNWRPNIYIHEPMGAILIQTITLNKFLMFGFFSNPPRKSTTYQCNPRLRPYSHHQRKGLQSNFSNELCVQSLLDAQLREEPLGPVLVKNYPWLFPLSFSFSWSNSIGTFSTSGVSVHPYLHTLTQNFQKLVSSILTKLWVN